MSKKRRFKWHSLYIEKAEPDATNPPPKGYSYLVIDVRDSSGVGPRTIIAISKKLLADLDKVKVGIGGFALLMECVGPTLSRIIDKWERGEEIQEVEFLVRVT